MPHAPTWQEAMSVAAGLTAPLASHRVPLHQAAGATLASALHTSMPLPHYDSSAMDGYVIATSDTTRTGPWRLDPEPDAADPHAASGARSLAPGHARAVLTGGLIPSGARGVIRAEFAREADGQVYLDAPDDAAAAAELAAGRHIRPAGCEAAAGSLMVPAGTVLSPALVAYLTVAGFDEVPVRRAPRVSVLATGDEVVPRGLPGPGQVRDSFTPVMPAILRGLGADPVHVAHYDDDPAVLAKALHTAVDTSDLVITTGGTGRSGADVVRRLLTTDGPLARTPVFEEIAMRPGHPTLAVTAAPSDGSSGTGVPIIALPGNPLAAMVALRVVVQPVLEAMLGREPRPARQVPVTETAAAGRADRLVPAQREADGTWRTCAAAGAHMLRGLASAEGLLGGAPVRHR